MPPLPPEYVKNMEEQRRQGRTVDQTLLLGNTGLNYERGLFLRLASGCGDSTGNGPVSIEIEHKHDFDEIIGFAGSNRNYPRELCGEIEFSYGRRSTYPHTYLLCLYTAGHAALSGSLETDRYPDHHVRSWQ